MADFEKDLKKYVISPIISKGNIRSGFFGCARVVFLSGFSGKPLRLLRSHLPFQGRQIKRIAVHKPSLKGRGNHVNELTGGSASPPAQGLIIMHLEINRYALSKKNDATTHYPLPTNH